jgi:flagellar motor switch protein FliG
MASEGDSKIRRIAIVLQSMDTDTVRKLLSQFPDDVARAIRRAFSNLGTVSPAERAAAAQDLQSLLGKPAIPKSEFNPASQVLNQSGRIQDAIQLSREARFAAEHSVQPTSQPARDTYDHSPVGSHPSGRNWLSIPPPTLVRVLENERAVVIAAVLHELPVVMATSVLQLLPIPKATETMAAMPHLHRNDPSLLEELLDQIAAKAEEAIRSEQRASLGIEKLKAIVAHASEDQRYLWASSLSHLDPHLPTELGWNQGTPEAEPYSPQQRPLQSSHPPLESEPVILPIFPAKISKESEASDPKPDKAPEFQSLLDLLKLEDIDFVTVLHAVEPELVLLALTGADRKFQKRVERLMHKKDVSRLRQRIQGLHEIPLREIDRAQDAILEKANDLASTGKLGIGSIISFSAAA